VPGSAPGESLVWVDGRIATVSAGGGRGRRNRERGPGRSAGIHTVTAPMPGRVVRILVGPGDEVALRDPVVVIEAMKMENELRSPRAGRVKEVQVTAGASVDAGSVLVVLE
jgi:biotin carboxyl carrier protein